MIAALAIALAWTARGPSETGPGAARFLVPLPPGTYWPGPANATEWVPSPDGRNLAMVAAENQNNMLWVRPLNGDTAHKLDKTDGANFPFWSPDGQFIGFFADDKLKRVAVTGGAVQTICDWGPVGVPAAGRAAGASGATWSKSGVIVFGVVGKPLMRVSAQGGTPEPATEFQKDERDHVWPQFLPDGRHLLYLARGAANSASATYVQELGTSKRTMLLKNASRTIWTPQGFLLYTRDFGLFAHRIDAQFHMEGEPLPIADEVISAGAEGRSTVAASANGVLVFRRGHQTGNLQLIWRDRDGKSTRKVGNPGEFATLELSPDEKSASMLVGAPGAFELWLMDLSGGIIAPLSRNGRLGLSPHPWSPDSKRILVTTAGGIEAITVASGRSDIVTTEQLVGEDWMPDGRSVLVADHGATRHFLLSLAKGAKPQPLLTTRYMTINMRISPDGKYVAYESEETGRSEVFVASFPSFAEKHRLSTGGGSFPLWTKGSKEVVYVSPERKLVTANVRTGAGIEIGERNELFSIFTARGPRFGVSGDGRRLLLREVPDQAAPPNPEITVVLNWFADLGQAGRFR